MGTYKTPSREMIELQSTLLKTIQAYSKKLEQTVKWSWPTFVYKGNICNVIPFSKHVNVHFFDGVSIKDPTGKLTGTGKGMRHVSYSSAKDIDRSHLHALLKQAMALNDRKESSKPTRKTMI